MTANDIKLLTESNFSENAKHLTLRDLEDIADICDIDPDIDITDELVEQYNAGTLLEYIMELQQ